MRALSQLPGVGWYAHQEALSLSVTRTIITLPHLPSRLDGMTIVFLTDMHCGPTTSPAYLQKVIDKTNRLRPDLVALGGDYVFKFPKYIPLIADVLSQLKAPLGVYAVFGNHDHWINVNALREAFSAAGIVDLTNSGRWLTTAGSRIRIAGVGDLWEDHQDLLTALEDARDTDTVILL